MHWRKLFQDSQPGVEIEVLEAFEVGNSVVLPREYREFLLAVNGGVPGAKFRYVFLDGVDMPLSDIQLFLGILPDGPGYADIGATAKWVEGRIPRGVVPIASDSGGNLFLMELADCAVGAVSYWRHDVMAGGSNQLTNVSGSFSKFLERVGEWAMPTDPGWLQAIERKDGESVLRMLDDGLSPHVRYEGLSMVEYAAIHAQDDLVVRLIAEGVELGEALELAKENAVFFSQNHRTVSLLERAESARDGYGESHRRDV